jgi:4-hydroxy-tetrahydrodipicolinate synthase
MMNLDMDFNGIVPVLATPFTHDGEIDEESFRRLVDWTVEAGVRAVAMFGLASEYYKLTDLERTRLTGILLDQVRGRVPVVISVTEHATHAAVQRARAAATAGADALMVMPPFFLQPAEDSVRRHIEAIASAVAIPVIIQHAPLQTGSRIAMSTFAGIQRDCPNVTHIKIDLIPSGPAISAVQSASGGKLRTLVGYAGLHLPEAVARGVDGCMPSCSLSRVFVRLFSLLKDGREEGYLLHRRLLPLLLFMMQSIEIMNAAEKYILARQRVIASDYCREPAAGLDSFQLGELERVMAEQGAQAPDRP